MLTPVELQKKREHKAELRRRRGPGPHGLHNAAPRHTDSWMGPRTMDFSPVVPMEQGYFAAAVAVIRRLFSKRRGR